MTLSARSSLWELRIAAYLGGEDGEDAMDRLTPIFQTIFLPDHFSSVYLSRCSSTDALDTVTQSTPHRLPAL